MQVSFKWLKEYVDIDITPQELADKLTAAGVTVERVESLDKGIENVVVGKVLEAEPHPNSDHLSLCKVTTDGENELQVVCGAPNVRKGQWIPFAQVGAKLPGGIKIKKSKIRGLESQGMICSAKELGINDEGLSQDQREGILVLDEDAPLGTNIVEYLNLDDYILELDLTPNRSDCLSIINIAREIGAILGKEVKLPSINFTEIEKTIEDVAKVEISAPEYCHRYVARMVEGVKIKPSPQWLQHKLRSAGIRSINNVVDITNLVMLEFGQPLHAFDYNLLAEGKIIVRLAKEGEKITTLDGNERNLTSEMLLITDPQKAVGIAGVMGGENTEITADSTTILIEAAYFEPTNIRKTATKLGLRSDASVRFEKGINMETVVSAANRAVQLMEQLAEGKVLKGMIDNYPTPKEKTFVTLEMKKVNDVLGTEISFSEIKEILIRLNFTITEETKETITVLVPPYRPDVTIAEDLIEEVARLYGYDNIPTTLPYGATNQGRRTPEQVFRDKIINILANRGLNEMINFSFINKNNLDKLLLSADDEKRDVVKVLNPLSEEQGIMRTTLVPGLLDSMNRNINRRNEDIAGFELGKVYEAKGFPENKGLPKETWMLGIALRGNIAKDWQHKGEIVDFYYLKGIVEDLFQQLNLDEPLFEACTDNPTYHPGRTANIILKGVKIGVMGEIHPQVAENYDLLPRNYVLELNVEQLFAMVKGTTSYQQLPKYPAVTRDLAVVVKDEVTAYQLMAEIKVQGGGLLKDIEIFDLYKGNQIQEGYKSIAFSLVFQAQDRTLTDAEINEIHGNIQKALADKFAASLRA